MLEVKIVKVSINQMGFAIILKSSEYSNMLPIFIAPLEASAISNILEGQRSGRPMTHDLTKNLIENLGFVLEKIFIDHYSNGIFYAKLHLLNKGKSRHVIEVDARPSDAIALAMRFKASMFVNKDVYQEHSVDMEAPRSDFYSHSENMLDGWLPSIKNISSDDLFGSEMIDSLLEEFALSEYEAGERDENFHEANYVEGKRYKDKKQVLQQMLDSAVAREKYEDAAIIRDEIKSLIKPTKKERSEKS